MSNAPASCLNDAFWRQALPDYLLCRFSPGWFSGKRVLCLGHDAAVTAYTLAAQGAHVRWIIHLGEPMPAARRSAPAVCFERADLNHPWPEGEHFDLIVHQGLIPYLESIEVSIRQSCRYAPNVVVETDVLDCFESKRLRTGDFHGGLIDPWVSGYRSLVSTAHLEEIFERCGAWSFRIVAGTNNERAPAELLGAYSWPSRDSQSWDPRCRRLWLLRPQATVPLPASEQISVIVQGPVAGAGGRKLRHRLTEQCLDSLRQILPQAEIILSTWDGEDTANLNVDRIVCNADPGGTICDDQYQVRNNVNRQIVSSVQGILQATRPYCLKVRSDLVLMSDQFLRFWNVFPQRDAAYRFTASRMLSCSIFARRFAGSPGQETRIVFHPSDFLFFGFRDDLLSLFDQPLAPEPLTSRWFTNHGRSIWTHDCYAHALCRFFPEQYLWIQFLNKFLQIDLHDRLDLSHPHVVHDIPSQLNNLVVLDQSQWKFRLPKYDLREYSLAGYDWNGLFRHQVWRQLYAEFCGIQTVPPSTYDTRMRYVFHDGHLARGLAKLSPRLFRYLHRRLKKQRLFP